MWVVGRAWFTVTEDGAEQTGKPDGDVEWGPDARRAAPSAVTKGRGASSVTMPIDLDFRDKGRNIDMDIPDNRSQPETTMGGLSDGEPTGLPKDDFFAVLKKLQKRLEKMSPSPPKMPDDDPIEWKHKEAAARVFAPIRRIRRSSGKPTCIADVCCEMVKEWWELCVGMWREEEQEHREYDAMRSDPLTVVLFGQEWEE